jgi:hypothetical protein
MVGGERGRGRETSNLISIIIHEILDYSIPGKKHSKTVYI